MAKTMTTKVRERLVTRTIISCVYTCMVVVGGKEVGTETITLGNVTSEKPEKIEKILREKCTGLFVQIINMEIKEVVMGMSEDDFIKYAHVIER